MSEEKVDDYGEPISSISKGEDGKPDFRQNHGCCRDLYCLIIFIAAIIAMIVIFAIGFTKGDPRKLIYPLNENGMYCGLTVNRTELKDFPYLFRPNLANNTKEVCVKECPKANQCFLDNNDGTGSFEDIETEQCIAQLRFPTFLMTDLIYRCIPDPKAVGDAAEL
ncbi:MAG: hypothetical protein EZS28_034790 [Streblomastix strix]|nr:MAG: hypothetical protein EZS28_034790 [Streblomastix strix]